MDHFYFQIQGVIYNETAAANYPPGVFNMAAKSIPARRTGTVEEISSAVVFLLSPSSSYITGTTVRVDGGQVLANAFWKVPKHTGKWPPFGKSKCIYADDDEGIVKPDSKMSSNL